MGEFEQNLKINNLANAINSLSETQELQLIKLDRPINYDKFIGNLDKKISTASNDLEKGLLQCRKEQLENLNADDKTYRPFYYFVIYDDNEKALNEMVKNGFEIGNHGYFHKDHAKLSYEKNVEEISFTAAERQGETEIITKEKVSEMVGSLAKRSDLSKFIL